MSATATNGAGAETEAVEATPAPAEVSFPVESFKDAAPHLRRPFTPQAVKFKVQATWPKAEPTGGLIVSYIDARLVVERLNLICPHLWHDEYEERQNGLLCRLTVDGISRIDIGEGYQGKGLYSDALKRAAVKFGVGVSLYATPQIMLNVSDGHLKVKQLQGKKTAVLTPAGEARCRDLYTAWLEMAGVQAFGVALDHGDALDAAGDHEAEPEPEVDHGTDGEEAAPVKRIDGEVVKGLDAVIRRELKLPQERVARLFGAIGAEAPEDVKAATVQRALAALSEAQGTQMATYLQREADRREKAEEES